MTLVQLIVLDKLKDRFPLKIFLHAVSPILKRFQANKNMVLLCGLFIALTVCLSVGRQTFQLSITLLCDKSLDSSSNDAIKLCIVLAQASFVINGSWLTCVSCNIINRNDQKKSMHIAISYILMSSFVSVTVFHFWGRIIFSSFPFIMVIAFILKHEENSL